MAKLVFGMSQSLDGYVDGVAGDLELPPPGPALFHHFYEWARDLTGSVYGRRVYELMRFWDFRVDGRALELAYSPMRKAQGLHGLEAPEALGRHRAMASPRRIRCVPLL